MGRWALVDETDRSIAFLASAPFAFMTGHAVAFDQSQNLYMQNLQSHCQRNQALRVDMRRS
jgi:hypothetical protein